MKKNVSYLLLILLGFVPIMAQTPAWVNTHSVSDEEYVGIGMASLAEADYQQKATQNALADIASQIAVKLENNSFLHTVDVDGKARQLFEDKIQSSLTAWLEGQELKDSYQSDKTYYVYYVLNKKEYAKRSASRRSQVLESGMDYLNKGRNAEANMNLSVAAQMYAKGLETVESWTFMDLTSDGVNVPVELFNAYLSVFSGMAITTNVVNIEGEAFKPVATPIAGCLSKNGKVVPNVKLKLEFVSGGGEVSTPIETDATGTAEFYIKNITSKEALQELRLSVDDAFLHSLPSAYRTLLQSQTWPAAKITLQVKSMVTAYLHVDEDSELEGIENQLSRLLTNNYFTVTEDPDAAQCFVDITSKLEVGELVTGGIRNLNTCYCTLTVKFYNYKTEQLLLNYEVSRVKVLAPESNTAEKTLSMCVREVMKRVNRELPARIKKLNF